MKSLMIGGTESRILYEDDAVIAFVKPAGVLSQGVPSGERSVLDYIDEYADGAFRAYLVHRLDRMTGGVMLCAKSSSAAAELSELFSSGAIHKEYLAAAHGTIDEGARLEHDLYFDRTKNKAFTVKSSTGRRRVRHAVLDYVPKATFDDPCRTILVVTLHTGRTHQIRCQLAAVGHPLVGDRRYGGRGNSECSLWSRRIFVERSQTKKLSACARFIDALLADETLLSAEPSSFPWEA